MTALVQSRQMSPPSEDRAAAIINVLIVDEGDLSRACMVAGLESSPELMIESCTEIAEHQGATVPDLVLFQISRPTIDFAKLAAQVALVSERWPRAAALVVSDHVDGSAALEAVRAGARGLLTAEASVECLRSAILLLVNEIGVYPAALAELLRAEAEDPSSPPPVPPLVADPGQLASLTKRQQEVVQLLALGFSNRAIAERLDISESTVKVHVRAIMAQNGASNRTQVVAHFLKSNSQ